MTERRDTPDAIRARAARVEAEFPRFARLLRDHADLVERVRAPMTPIREAARREQNDQRSRA